MANDQWLGIELRHLAALEAVAREGSFRRAATSLGYVQSAISQQIAALERAVGQRLVERSRGGVRVELTEAGELVLQHADAILARLKAAQADVAALAAGQSGALRVGITQSVGVRILPALMRRYAVDWPDVTLRPVEAAADLPLYDAVERGDVDLSFVELPLPPGPFEAFELMSDPYVLVVRRDAPTSSLADLAETPLIGHTECRGLARVEAQLRARGIEPEFAFRSDVNATIQALVGARLGAGGERALLVAVGVVAGAAVLAAVLAGRLVMQDRALAESTAQLAPADRVVQVAWSGAVDSFAQHDRFVAPRIRSVTGQEPARAMLFREASVQGRLVNLRAADDLGRFVRITSGRLPRICVPQHCEVLRLEGRGPIPSTPALRLIEVGRASLRPGAPIGPFVLPTPPTEQVARAVRYHTPQPSPVVIANGVQGLSATRELQTFYRAYAWVVDIRGADVHPWSISEFGRKVQRLSAQVESNAAGEFQVTAPTVQLAAATTASDAAARRLLLLGGEGACLLLAFTILAAGALRRDVTDARRRLIWFGARRWQVELHTLAESFALATVGTIVGWIAGGAIAAAVAGEAGSPAGAVIAHGLLSGRGLLAALCLAAAAGLLLYATVRSRPVQFGRLAFTPL